MNKEVISDKQGISLIALFIMGSSIIIGTAMGAKKDLWISIILAIIIALPVLTIYARILYIFHGKNLMEITELLFGKFLGKFINILYVWYAIHLGSMVLRNFGEYITIVSLTDTPQIIVMVCVIFLCIYGTQNGIEVIGKFGQLSIVILLIILFFTIVLLIPNMELNNIRPMLQNGIKPVLGGAISTFSFPLGETVLFCMCFSALKNRKSSYKVYIFGLIIGGLILFSTSLSEILVLGENTYTSVYFPAHRTVSRIDIGMFFQRMEVVVAVSFIGAGFIKVSICLLAASKGIVKVFGLDDYRFTVTSIALLITNLSIIIFETIFDMETWDHVNPYYTSIFQVILPIFIWITAEIKKKRFENKY